MSRVEIIAGEQTLTILEGEHRNVLLTMTNPPEWGTGDFQYTAMIQTSKVSKVLLPLELHLETCEKR